MGLEMLKPLRHRDFRLLWIGQSVSQVGNGLYLVALPFQILHLGGTPLQLGTGFTTYSIAQLLTTLYGGALVDRVPRRRVLLTTDFLSALAVGVVAALGLTGNLRLWEIYAMSAFFGATFSFYQPALSAIMPELVPTEVLVPGNALRALSGRSARVLGPLLGGVVVAATGPSAAFTIDAASFLFSFVVFSFSRPPVHEPPPQASILANIREGVAFTFSIPWLWVTIVGFAVTNGIFFAGFTVAQPLLVLNVLHGSAATFGLIGATAAFGEVVGTLIVGNVRIKRLGVGVYVFSGLLGVGFAIYGAAPLLPVVLAGALAFATSIVIANTLWESALQKHVPRQLMGRVNSVDNFGSFIVAPIAPIVAGAIVGQVGPRAIYLVGGALSFAYWMCALAAVRTARKLE